MLHHQTLPFLLHALIETPAALQFLLLPNRQLGRPTPHAHALMRQYALLLLSSVLVALAFAFPSSSSFSSSSSSADRWTIEEEQFNGGGEEGRVRSKVAAALGLYHVGPAVRSMGRLRGRWVEGKGVVACEPAVYLVVHLVVGGMLGWCAWVGWKG